MGDSLTRADTTLTANRGGMGDPRAVHTVAIRHATSARLELGGGVDAFVTAVISIIDC